jgi:Fe-S-cluster containining protein
MFDSQSPNPVLRLLSEPALSCRGCGACCRLTPLPPFEPGECQQRGIPAEWLVEVTKRIQAGQQFDLLPCVWYDIDQDLCRHYLERPSACREFSLAGTACMAARRRVGSSAADG